MEHYAEFCAIVILGVFGANVEKFLTDAVALVVFADIHFGEVAEVAFVACDYACVSDHIGWIGFAVKFVEDIE